VDDRESGEPESVRFGFAWKVLATRPVTAGNRTRWEIAQDREKLSRARQALEQGAEFTGSGGNDLDAAFMHAGHGTERICAARTRGPTTTPDSRLASRTPPNISFDSHRPGIA